MNISGMECRNVSSALMSKTQRTVLSFNFIVDEWSIILFGTFTWHQLCDGENYQQNGTCYHRYLCSACCWDLATCYQLQSTRICANDCFSSFQCHGSDNGSCSQWNPVRGNWRWIRKLLGFSSPLRQDCFHFWIDVPESTSEMSFFSVQDDKQKAHEETQ